MPPQLLSNRTAAPSKSSNRTTERPRSMPTSPRYLAAIPLFPSGRAGKRGRVVVVSWANRRKAISTRSKLMPTEDGDSLGLAENRQLRRNRRRRDPLVVAREGEPDPRQENERAQQTEAGGDRHQARDSLGSPAELAPEQRREAGDEAGDQI